MTPDEALDRLRSICLAFPGAVEAGGVGNPTFKVRDNELADLIQESYRMTAPKCVAAALDREIP